MAGVVVAMLWLFLTAYVIVLAAELNSEAERQTAQDTTTGRDRPLGERDAEAADTVGPTADEVKAGVLAGADVAAVPERAASRQAPRFAHAPVSWVGGERAHWGWNGAEMGIREPVMTNASWKIAAGLAGAAAGWATRSALRAVWQRAKGEQPPENPAGPQTTWPDALLWAIGSGVALAVARLVAQRGAAEAWHVATGSYPTEVVESGSAA